MQTKITLREHAHGSMIGMRSSAMPLRKIIEQSLQQGHEVVIDFTGIEATQGFVDELVGALVLRQGPSVIEQLLFKSCSDGVKAILRYVVNDRAGQFEAAAQDVVPSLGIEPRTPAPSTQRSTN